MPKQINYQLSKNEREQVEKAQKTGPSPQVRQRATGIRLLHMGKKPGEVAELLNVTVSTVYEWHKRWRERGIDGLEDEPRSGRPQLATAEYCTKLEALLERDPQELGYGFTLWTLDRLIAHLKQETGISMSDETFRKVLQYNGYVYRRPKHDLNPLQDAEAKQTAEELLESLKKGGNGRNPPILYGRNNLDLASDSAQMLDETGPATLGSGCRSTATPSHLWRLQRDDR